MKRKPALAWEPDYDGFKAQTAIGMYRVEENKAMMGGTYGASFQPPQGRSRLPKEWQGLGISDTIEEAKALCERHFAGRALPQHSRMILPVTDVAVITAGSHVRGVSATHARAFALADLPVVQLSKFELVINHRKKF
jgi:hypothetical protein